MNLVRAIGFVLVGLSGVATVGLALGVLGLVVYLGYQWLGILGGFLAFWLGGTLAFGIVNLAILPIRFLGVGLMVFADKEKPMKSAWTPSSPAQWPRSASGHTSAPPGPLTPLPSPSPGPPRRPATIIAADEAKAEATDRLRLARASYDELRSRLPPLPPAVRQRRVDITERTFIAWDLMNPWGITAVAFLKGDDGEFTVWTPGQFIDWVWRGPSHVPNDSAELLAKWLTQRENSVLMRTKPGMPARTEVGDKRIWMWDPDPESEVGFGLLRLDDGGFELSLMMAGLRRGGAHIGSEDGHVLAQWLVG